MASSKTIKLEKTIISNESSNSKYTKTFSKLSKSEEYIDEEKIKKSYDDLFYNIPIDGKSSHKNIIEQSHNYINYNYLQGLRNQIKSKLTQVSEKSYALEELTTPTSKDPALRPHPLYEEGSFLIAGENGIKYQDMDTMYIMQEGRKRAFVGTESGNVFMQVRRALGLPEDHTGKYYLTIEELNQIPDGPNISSTSDLNKKGNELIVDLGDIQGLSATYTIQLTCLGNEVQDIYNLVLDEDNAAAGQFYLDQGGCVVKYIFDEYTTDDVNYVVKTLNLARNETKTIDILRRTNIGNNNIPSNISSLYQDPAVIEYNGNEVSNYHRNWGPYGRYESIVYVDGRVAVKEEYSAHISNTQGGQDTSVTLLNGLPATGTGFWDVVSETPVQEYSVYGTKRIYMKGSGMHGALNQNLHLQETIFDNLDNPYYDPENYGQPIIRFNKRYWVMKQCYSYRSAFGIIGRAVECLLIDFTSIDGIEQGKSAYITRKTFRDKTGANIDYKSNTMTIYGLKWHEMDTHRIKYVGLQDVQTKEYVGSGNYFNLSGNQGSNTELVGFSQNFTY